MRRLVIDRSGRSCEYCLVHEESAGFPHQIDHIISRKHGVSSGIGNLAYACVLCNRYKGSDIASVDRAGQPIPRWRAWRETLKDLRGDTVHHSLNKGVQIDRRQPWFLPLATLPKIGRNVHRSNP